MHTNYQGTNPYRDFDHAYEGHWGWRADEILVHLPAWAAAAHPDIVLLLLGGNDVNQGQSITSTIEELEQIINVLRDVNPAVTILLATLMPTTRPFNDVYLQLNTQIPGLAASKSVVRSPILLVDQHSGFDARHDTYDGLHPNARGEQKMACQWYHALRPNLDTLRPTVITHA